MRNFKNQQGQARLLPRGTSGQVFIVSIIIMTVVLLLTITLLAFLVFGVQRAQKAVIAEQALHLAEAGIDKAIWSLNQNPAYSGETDTILGDGLFTTTIATEFTKKIIQSTGCVPKEVTGCGKTSTKHSAKKTIRVAAGIGSGQGITFRFAVQVGEKGLIMDSNSEIFGNVYSNGSITGAANTTIGGDAAAQTTISSPNPVVTGTKTTGVPQEPLPFVDVPFWQQQARKPTADSAGATNPIVGNYTAPAGNSTLGPHEITGNLTIPSNSTIAITGPVYVHGDINFQSNTIVNLDPAFTTSGTVILADGSIRLNSNVIVNGTTSSSGQINYILFVSTKGIVETGTSAIISDSNASLTAAFYALNGTLEFSSNVHPTAIVANQIKLNSNATVTYDQGLASASFSSGPGGSYQLIRSTWQEIK